MKQITYKIDNERIIRKLPDFLQNLGREVEKDIKHVNQGGCCVYASLLACKIKRLFPFIWVSLKVVNHPCYRVININTRKREIKDEKGLVYNWNAAGIFLSHILVELKYKKERLLCDSTFVLPYQNEITLKNGDKLIVNRGYLTLNEGLALSKDTIGWNEMFDRKQIPQLRQIVRKEFKSFVKSIKV